MKNTLTIAFVGASALALAACNAEAPADEVVEETTDAVAEEGDAMAEEGDAMAEAAEETAGEGAETASDEEVPLDVNGNPIGPR